MLKHGEFPNVSTSILLATPYVCIEKISKCAGEEGSSWHKHTDCNAGDYENRRVIILTSTPKNFVAVSVSV